MIPLFALSLLAALISAPNRQVAQTAPSQPPSVTTILPADTPVVGLVNTKAAWNTLGQFQLFQTVYTAAKAYLPSNSQFDYGRDVESWMGDQVALALLPKVGSAEVTIDSNFLMLASVKDEGRLRQLLAQIRAGEQQHLTELNYRGVTILEWKAQGGKTPPYSPQKPKLPAPVQSSLLQQLQFPNLSGQLKTVKPNYSQPNQENGLAIAVLPGYLVVANTAKPIEQLLDVPKGSNTLAQNSQFQRTIQRPEVGQQLFIFYEDPAKFLPLFNSIAKDPSFPFPFFVPGSIRPEQVKDYSTLDGFVLVQPEGLHFQFNAYRQTPQNRANVLTTSESDQIVARLPGSTYTVSTSSNLKQQWQTLVAATNVDPKLSSGLTQLRSCVRTTTGLDIDQDIVGWMDGDYALFSYPTKKGISSLLGPKFNLGVGFLIQTSNRAAAEATMKKLDQFVKSYSNGSVTAINRSIKGEPVTSWEVQRGNSSGSLFAYSWVDKDTLLVTTGYGAMADLVPPPYQSLPKTYTFTTATNSLPSPNQGYFYLNMGSLLSWAYGLVPPQYNEPSVRPFKQLFGTIYSISATTSATPEREQVDSLVVLAPARK